MDCFQIRNLDIKGNPHEVKSWAGFQDKVLGLAQGGPQGGPEHKVGALNLGIPGRQMRPARVYR
jgi:hypothetical protein